MPYIIVRDSAGSDSNIYVFRNGVYSRYSRAVFAGAIKSLVKAYDPDLKAYDPDLIDDTALDKTVSLICKSEKYVNFESLNTDERYINLQNRLLDIKTMKLLPHDPKVYSTIQLPIQLPLSFDPTALAAFAAFGSLCSASDTANSPTSAANSSNLAVVPAHNANNDSNNNSSNNSGGLNSAHSANSLKGLKSIPASHASSASHDSHASSSALATLDSHALATPTTPVFDRYLNTLTNGREDKKRFLLEYLGACLSNVPGFKMKKALFLYGVGDTGKLLLKRLAERLLGIGNYTGIDLSQMEERFGASSIYGKRLADSADMSFMTISELKIFKKATGGDVIRTEFKGKDSFDFTYKGLLWFCMNRLPKFGGDNGQWVYDRIIPVHCPTV